MRGSSWHGDECLGPCTGSLLQICPTPSQTGTISPAQPHLNPFPTPKHTHAPVTKPLSSRALKELSSRYFRFWVGMSSTSSLLEKRPAAYTRSRAASISCSASRCRSSFCTRSAQDSASRMVLSTDANSSGSVSFCMCKCCDAMLRRTLEAVGFDPLHKACSREAVAGLVLHCPHTWVSSFDAMLATSPRCGTMRMKL